MMSSLSQKGVSVFLALTSKVDFHVRIYFILVDVMDIMANGQIHQS